VVCSVTKYFLHIETRMIDVSVTEKNVSIS